MGKKIDLRDGIYRWCLRCIACIGMLFLFFFTVYSLLYTHRMYTESEDMTIVKDGLWKHLLFMAGILLLSAALHSAKFLTEKVLHGLAIFIAFSSSGIIMILVCSAHAYAVSNDQLHVYLAAVEMAKGNFFELGIGEYFGVYPFQLGLSTLYSLLYRLGAEGPEAIQGVHALCVGVTVYIGFRITRELCRSRAAEGIYLLLAVMFLPMHLYALFLYGEVISVCGMCLGIWFFIRANSQEAVKRRLMWWLPAILAMGIAYIVRPSMLIVWIAMTMIQILVLLKDKKPFSLLLPIAMLIIMLSGQKIIMSSVEARTSADLNRGMPVELLLAMGLQGDLEAGELPGAYNAYTWTTFAESGFDPESAGEVAQEYLIGRIREWLRHPMGGAAFFKAKLLNQWNEPSYGVFSATRFMDEPEEWVVKAYYGKGNELLYGSLNLCQSAIYALAFCYVLFLVFGRENAVSYLPGLVLVGGILFSAIWEAKSRYVFPYIVAILPYAAGGAVRLMGAIRHIALWMRQKEIVKRAGARLSARAKEADWMNLVGFGLCLILYSAMMEFLFYRQALHFEGKYYTDISPYIYHMQGIDTGYAFPYPIMFAVGRFFCLFCTPERAMAIALTVLNGLGALLLKHYVDIAVKRVWKWGACPSIIATALTFSMLFVSMLFFDLGEASVGQRYQGVFSPNPFHNATYLAARPFSIVCFFMMIDLLQIYEQRIPKKKYATFSLFLLLSTMTKPSFALGFILLSAILLLYCTCRKRFTNIGRTFVFAGSAFPAMLFLLYQYSDVFVGQNGNGEESGIGFGWLTAWSTQEYPIGAAILRGLAFPIVVAVLHWKDIRRHAAFRLALEYLAINMGMLLCLYEKGFRMAHVNFAWGYMYGMFFAFVIGGLVVLEDTCGRKKSALVLGVQWGFYLWHLICGLVYFASLLGGSGYL